MATTHLVFDPVEFLGRLAVLVPRPRINLILYHGVLAPRAAWRADVVRRRSSGEGGEAGMTASATEPAREADPAETARRHTRGQTWASLMARTFGLDVLACPRCGGRLRLVALIEEAAVIDRILRHLGLPTETPAPCPARAPPLPSGTSRRGWLGRRRRGLRRVFLSDGRTSVRRRCAPGRAAARRTRPSRSRRA